MLSLLSFALSTEKPNNKLMKIPPCQVNDPIITTSMWRSIIIQSLYQIIMLSIILMYKPIHSLLGISVVKLPQDDWTFENGKLYSFFFNTFVMIQVFNQVSNSWNVIVLTASVCLQYMFAYFGGIGARCVCLTVQELFVSIIFGVGSLFTEIIFKQLIPIKLLDVLNSIPEMDKKIINSGDISKKTN